MAIHVDSIKTRSVLSDRICEKNEIEASPIHIFFLNILDLAFLHTLFESTTMTCLIDRVLSGAGMKSHTFMLGMFLYTPWHYVCRFSRKNLCRFLGKSSKLFIVVTLGQ